MALDWAMAIYVAFVAVVAVVWAVPRWPYILGGHAAIARASVAAVARRGVGKAAYD